MAEINKNRLTQKADTYGICLTQAMAEQLSVYASLLVEWNNKFNLTNIVQPEEIENKHFIDSLLFAMQAEVQGKIADVGTGAGFPGIVTKIYKPEINLTLIEPTGKRVLFLQEVCHQLGLEVEILKERAEEAGRKGWREGFDVVTARAVAAMPILSEYCLPLTKVGGVFIAMKADGEEGASTSSAYEKLGGCYQNSREFTLPDGSYRNLIFIEKIKSTAAIYPRNGGVIKKRPLQ